MTTTLPVMTIAEVIGDSDGFPTHDADTHFERGVKTGESMEYVAIAVNNVWGGRSKDGAGVSSYEKIGYHAGSVDFIKGVLSTGCPVRVYRYRYGGRMEFELVKG